MRILLANESARAHRGGVNRMVGESCELLQQAGHTVGLAYFDAGPSEVSCQTYSWPNTADAREIARTVEKVLSDFQPEIVQLHHDAQPPLFPNAIAERVPTCRFIHDQSWFCSSDNRMARDGTPVIGLTASVAFSGITPRAAEVKTRLAIFNVGSGFNIENRLSESGICASRWLLSS